MPFKPETSARLGYYVYRLVDPRNAETFYVGKGKGDRIFQHAKDAQVDPNDDTADYLSDKIARIREIIVGGLEVLPIIHRHGLSEDTAFEVEGALMDAYPGLTNLAGGRGSLERGAAHVDEISALYDAKEIVVEDRLIAITVNRSLEEFSIYEAARAAWKLSVTNAESTAYVLAVRNRIVIGVYSATRWLPAHPKYFPRLSEVIDDRFGFEGVEAPQGIQERYLGRRLPARLRGASNPIEYLFPVEAA